MVGLVFFVSSTGKLRSRASLDAFVDSVRGLRLLPNGLPNGLPRLVALGVVAAELGVCLALAVPLAAATAVGLALAAGLLAAFTVGVGLMVGRGAREPCRCFGRSSTPLGPEHVARNAVLTGVAVLGAVAATTATAGSAQAAGAILAAMAGLALGSIVIAFDDIIELFRPAGSASGRHGSHHAG